MTLRSLDLKDEQCFAATYAEAFHQSQGVTRTWSQDELKHELQAQHVWGAWDGITLVGFLVAQQIPTGDAEILSIGVLPLARGRGVGFDLVTWWINHYCPRSRVVLEVHESNQNAQKLYKKLGFRQIASRPHYYPDGGAALVLDRRP